MFRVGLMSGRLPFPLRGWKVSQKRGDDATTPWRWPYRRSMILYVPPVRDAVVSSVTGGIT